MQQCCKNDLNSFNAQQSSPFSFVMRSFYSLSFSLIITILHIGCCILPLLSLASLPIFDTGFLARHQLMLTVLQWAVFIWLSGRLAAFYFWNKNFHSRMERFSYLFGWFIALSGLVINRWEPFKSEEQILAEQHFERFKTQRQLRIDLARRGNVEELLADLREIDGVRKGSITLESKAVTLSYHKEKVSPEQILAVLKSKGHLK
jgi:ABC-type multidrug transport system fused ATPase/permease subunit